MNKLSQAYNYFTLPSSLSDAIAEDKEFARIEKLQQEKERNKALVKQQVEKPLNGSLVPLQGETQ